MMELNLQDSQGNNLSAHRDSLDYVRGGDGIRKSKSIVEILSIWYLTKSGIYLAHLDIQTLLRTSV